MRILITGATGLVGTEIVEELLRRGHDLVIATRNTEKAKKSLPFPCDFVEWDAQSPLPDEAQRDIDAVLNLAGEPVAQWPWNEERKHRIHDSRVVSSKAIVDAIRMNLQFKPHTLVSASAVGFYGDRGDQILDESSQVGEGFLADVARDWEKEIFSAPANVRTTAVRIGIVLAANGGALKAMLPAFRAGIAGSLGGGRQWVSWIHLKDLVRLFVHALESNTVSGVLNGTAPHPVTNAEFTKTLARQLKRPGILPAPRFALRAALGEMSNIVLASQNALPRRTLESGFRFEFEKLEFALADLLPGGANLRELIDRVWIPRPRDEVWKFFSNEKNLETLTPEYLNFTVLGKDTQEIKKGTLIDYRLKLHGIPLKWRTLIDEWEPGVRFTDTQLNGPYKVWRHTHTFESVKGGTLMKDRVLYQVPAGWLGRAAAGWYVDGDVQAIFDFRRKKIRELFG
jgi:uncharacterized protein